MLDKYGYSKMEIETAHKNVTKETVLDYIVNFQGDRATLQEIFNDFVSLEIDRSEASLLASLRRIFGDHNRCKVEIVKALEECEAAADKRAIRLGSTIPRTRL